MTSLNLLQQGSHARSWLLPGSKATSRDCNCQFARLSDCQKRQLHTECTRLDRHDTTEPLGSPAGPCDKLRGAEPVSIVFHSFQKAGNRWMTLIPFTAMSAGPPSLVPAELLIG